jgi:IS1 family transposase
MLRPFYALCDRDVAILCVTAGEFMGKTTHIERFNNTLRQRLSRLVRDTLSFSKKVENHIGAIKFFICHYNLEKAAALPV